MRTASRDQRAEHDEQQGQRDRQRGDLRLPEVLAGQGAGYPVEAGVARLGDGQPLMPGRDAGDRPQRGHHGLVLVAAASCHIERDQGRPAAAQAGRGERRPDVRGGPRQSPQRGDDLAGRLPQPRVVGEGLPGGVRLDEDALPGGMLHTRPVQDPFRLARLAGIVAWAVARAEMLAGQQRRGHQEQPAGHGDDPVPGRPGRDPFHHGCPHGLSCPVI